MAGACVGAIAVLIVRAAAKLTALLDTAA